MRRIRVSAAGGSEGGLHHSLSAESGELQHNGSTAPLVDNEALQLGMWEPDDLEVVSSSGALLDDPDSG